MVTNVSNSFVAAAGTEISSATTPRMSRSDAMSTNLDDCNAQPRADCTEVDRGHTNEDALVPRQL